MTPEIQALRNGNKTPQQMSLADLLIAAVPIAEGTAELGFVVEYGSSVARALLRMKAAVDKAPCACGENDGHLVHITTCWKAEL